VPVMTPGNQSLCQIWTFPRIVIECTNGTGSTYSCAFMQPQIRVARVTGEPRFRLRSDFENWILEAQWRRKSPQAANEETVKKIWFLNGLRNLNGEGGIRTPGRV
jgi:hypothetical protein